MRITSFLAFILVALVHAACVDSFAPPKGNTDINFLVISASVNATTGVLDVNISRAIPLASDEAFPRVTNAAVVLKEQHGPHHQVPHQSDGHYQISNLTIDMNNDYSLRVTTPDGEVYESDWITITKSPDIQGVSWERGHGGINIVLSTQDVTNTSRYYHWEYSETFVEQAQLFSHYLFDNIEKEVHARRINEYVNICYDNDQSKKIIVGTTEKLNNDIVNKMPIAFIPKDSPKLYFEYSILIKQRVLTKEAYAYFELLRTTTESLGGLFDPQPTSVLGNFRNINNTSEPVLGYFYGGEEKEYRFFLKRSDLPSDLRSIVPQSTCSLDTLLIENIPDFAAGGNILIDEIRSEGSIIGYHYTETFCGDCRTKGGNTEKPAYWPN